MKEYYCFKCHKDMPFLEEDEWSRVAPHLGDAVKEIKEYREEHECDLTTARLNVKPKAMQLFEEMTGMAGVHFEIIMHHRLKDWGQECPVCHYLLRTPKAKYCIKCGWEPNTNANKSFVWDLRFAPAPQLKRYAFK